MTPADADPRPLGRRTFLAAAALAVGALADRLRRRQRDGTTDGDHRRPPRRPPPRRPRAPPTPPPSTAPAAAQFVVSGPTDHDRVALTFHTNGDLGLVDQLLDVLAEHDACT